MQTQTKYLTLGIALTIIALGIAGYSYALITNNGNGTWTFSYTVNSSDAIRINNAFANVYNYQSTLYYPNGTSYANPQAKSAFTEAKIKGYINEVVAADDANTARQQIVLPPAPTVS